MAAVVGGRPVPLFPARKAPERFYIVTTFVLSYGSTVLGLPQTADPDATLIGTAIDIGPVVCLSASKKKGKKRVGPLRAR